MYQINQLKMISKKDVPVTAEYFVQTDGAKTLVVMLSGKGYGYTQPLLFYATNVALQCGCDIVHMPYYFAQNKASFDFENEGDIQAVVADCVAVLRTCLQQNDYEEIIFLSKSIGGVFAQLVAMQMGDVLQKEPQHFILTPVEQSVPFICSRKCAAVFGDADTFTSVAAKTQMLEAALSTVYAIPDADHSLEVKGDYKKSLAILGRTMDIWYQFYKITKAPSEALFCLSYFVRRIFLPFVFQHGSINGDNNAAYAGDGNDGAKDDDNRFVQRYGIAHKLQGAICEPPLAFDVLQKIGMEDHRAG